MSKKNVYFPTIEQVGVDYVCDLPSNCVIPQYGLMGALPMRSFESGDNAIGLNSYALALLPNLRRVHIKLVSSTTGLATNCLYGLNLDELVIDSSNGSGATGAVSGNLSTLFGVSTVKKLNASSITEFIFSWADKGLRDSIVELILKNAKTISAGSFKNSANIRSCDAESVEIIGSFGFNNCTLLTSVNIPNVVQLGDASGGAGSVFEGCTSLEEVGDMNNLEWMQSKTFSGCTNLKKIGRVDNLKYIGGGVFSSCINLESIGGGATGVARMPALINTTRSISDTDYSLSHWLGDWEGTTVSKFHAMDIPSCTTLSSFTRTSPNPGSGSALGVMHVRLGALDTFYKGAGSSSLRNGGVVLINRTRNDFLAWFEENEVSGLFTEEELTTHLICNDDPEWDEWSSWFDGGAIVDDVPTYPLSASRNVATSATANA